MTFSHLSLIVKFHKSRQSFESGFHYRNFFSSNSSSGECGGLCICILVLTLRCHEEGNYLFSFKPLCPLLLHYKILCQCTPNLFITARDDL